MNKYSDQANLSSTDHYFGMMKILERTICLVWGLDSAETINIQLQRFPKLSSYIYLKTTGVGGKPYKHLFRINDAILCIFTGSDIDVQVQITADHKGFFEFKVCPNNNFAVDPNQSCFER